MKPFSLERAKAGDAVMMTRGGHEPDAVRVHFIGIDMHGWAVVQYPHSQLARYDHIKTMDLHMAPKKVTVYVNFYKNGIAHHFYTKSAAVENLIQQNLLHTAVEVEVEE